jgi:predicted RND superfamily exporter protein
MRCRTSTRWPTKRWPAPAAWTRRRATFRLLFIPGTVALLCDVVGFSTLLIIDIGVIRELAISASVGVFVIIFTKMFLLPVLMSYAGLSAGGLQMARRRAGGRHRLAAALAALTVAAQRLGGGGLVGGACDGGLGDQP